MNRRKKHEQTYFEKHQVQNIKSLGSHCSYLHTHKKKMLNKLQINNYSWVHQRIEVTGQTIASKSRETGEYRE